MCMVLMASPVLMMNTVPSLCASVDHVVLPPILLLRRQSTAIPILIFTVIVNTATNRLAIALNLPLSTPEIPESEVLIS